MEEPRVSSNRRNWKTGMDKASYENKNGSEDRHSIATGSRSDPLSSLKSNRNRYHHSQEGESPELGFSQVNNRNNLINANRSPPACLFRGSEGSRSSSYTEGFSQSEDNEDDGTDIVVWGASKGPSHSIGLRQRHRSLSDTSDEPRLPPSCFRKSTLIQKARMQESRMSKSPNLAKAVRSDDNTSEYENQLFAVTEQLEMIKTTQDSILSELSNDISNLQYENVHLKNQNEHLTLRNSHLLQVINDLSNDVEVMRQVFRTRGWPLHQEDPRSLTEDIESLEEEIARPTQQNKLRLIRNQRFENIPLEDSSLHRPDISGAYPTGPGDDQVSAMSNRSKDHSLPMKNRNSKSKPRKSTGGCLRGLFKRKRKRDHHRKDEEYGLIS